MMRKLMKGMTVIFIAVFMISMNSCDELADVVPVPSMTATVDGEAWTSLARISVFNESATPQTIVITGKPTLDETLDETIILTVLGNDVGTYELGIGTVVSDECMVVYNKVTDTDTDVYTAIEATITISAMDKEKNTISGTYSAKCILAGTTSEVIISDGVFENLNYQVN